MTELIILTSKKVMFRLDPNLNFFNEAALHLGISRHCIERLLELGILVGAAHWI